MKLYRALCDRCCRAMAEKLEVEVEVEMGTNWEDLIDKRL